MHCIISEVSINLGQMLIIYMTEAASKAKVSLPYGMILTSIFGDLGVPILEEEPKRLFRHSDIYNIHSLHRMGYIKRNETWEKKSGEARPVEEGEEPREEHPPVSPSGSPTTSHKSPIHDTPSIPSIVHLDEAHLCSMVQTIDKEVVTTVTDSIKNEFTMLTEKLTCILTSEAQTISSTLQDISLRLAKVEDS